MEVKMKRTERIEKQLERKQFVWEVDPTDTRGVWLETHRPCSCGCDNREGKKGVGYIIGSDGGNGFTIWVENENVFKLAQQVIYELCEYKKDE
jgi:hypothetical protein